MILSEMLLVMPSQRAMADRSSMPTVTQNSVCCEVSSKLYIRLRHINSHKCMHFTSEQEILSRIMVNRSSMPTITQNSGAEDFQNFKFYWRISQKERVWWSTYMKFFIIFTFIPFSLIFLMRFSKPTFFQFILWY